MLKDILNTMTNNEQLSSFVTPYKNRLKKLHEVAEVFDVLIDYEDDIAEQTTATVQQFNQLANAVDGIIADTGNIINFTDPVLHEAVAIQLEHSNNSVILTTCGIENQIIIPSSNIFEMNLLGEEVRVESALHKLRSLKTETHVSVKEYATKVQEQIANYEISLEAVTGFLKNSSMAASDFAASIKSKYAGLSGDGLSLFQDLTEALTTHDVSSIVEVFKMRMNPQGVSQNSDGSVVFPETYVTENANFGAVIAASAGQVLQTVGMVVTALCAPLGIAMTAIGSIGSAIMTGIGNLTDNQVYPVVNKDSQCFDMGIKVLQEQYQYLVDQEWTDIRNSLFDNLSPVHYELPGMSGYFWCANPQALGANQKMVHEMYPSARSYLPLSSFNQWFHSNFDVTIDNSQAGFYHVETSCRNGVTTKSFLEWYFANCIPMTHEDWENLRENELQKRYNEVMASNSVCRYVMDALLMNEGAMARLEQNVPKIHSSSYINYSQCDMAMIGACMVNNLATGSSVPPVVPDPWAEGQTQINDQQIKDMCEGIDSGNMSIMLQTQYASFLNYVKDHTVFRDLTSGEDVDMHFMWSEVTVRDDFLVRPARWTKSSVIFNLVLSGIIIAAVATVTAIAALKVSKWRKQKRLEQQLATERAWDNAKTQGTPEAFKAYQKQVMKQNTIGRIYGCSRVDRTNYWGTPSTSASGGVSNIFADAQKSDLVLQAIIGD